MNTLKRFMVYLGLLEEDSSAIQFTDHAIRFAHYRKGRGNISLKHFHEVTLAPGIIVNGVICDEGVLVRILKAIRRQYGIRTVAVGLPESLFFVSYFYVKRRGNELPHITIQREVESYLSERFSQESEGFSCEYDIISEEQKGFMVHIAVTASEVTETYQRVMKKAGMRATSYHMNTQGVAHLHNDATDGKAYFALHINPTSSHIALVNNGAIVRSTERRFFGRENELESIGRTIRSMHNDWTGKRYPRRFERNPIEEVVIYGENTNGEYARKIIAHTSGLRAVYPDVWSGFSFDRKIPKLHARDTVRYAPVLGLALQRLRR